MSQRICYEHVRWRGQLDQFPDLQKLYNNFPPNIKESSYGQNIRDIMDSETTIHEGAEAVNFTALTTGRYDQTE